MYFAGVFQTVTDMSRPVPRQHVGLVGLVVALHDFHLLGAALFRRGAVFGSDGIRIDELLGVSRLGG